VGLEAKVEQEFLDLLPPWLLPLKLNLQGNTGWPDRLLLFLWPFIAFIEFKAPGRPLKGDRNQNERIAELRARGYPVLITDNAHEAIAFLESISLSDTGRKINDIAGMRGAPLAPRSRENHDLIRRGDNPSREEAD